MNKPKIGTIISGTLREEDLLEAFADELEDLTDDFAELITITRATDGDSPDAHNLVEELADALGNFALRYMYFGSLDGDGADFGFWPDLKGLKTSVFDGETLQINDPCDIPSDYVGDIMIVNDHGNIMFGQVKRLGGDYIAIWSCV